MSVQETIRDQVSSHPVVLYMKGSPQMPMCGFSATATQLLEMNGAQEIFTVDVLQNPEIREGIKQFANWPTIPQLYVNGEFVGGCDIMKEMHQTGELQKVLAPARQETPAPRARADAASLRGDPAAGERPAARPAQLHQLAVVARDHYAVVARRGLPQKL